MNSPFGRLSLWIIIAIAVLLLGGCMQRCVYPPRFNGEAEAPYGGLRSDYSNVAPVSHFTLLPVPRKDAYDISWPAQNVEQLTPPSSQPGRQPPPPTPSPQVMPPQGMPPQTRPAGQGGPQDRVARGNLQPVPAHSSHGRHQPPLAHHPAYPHR